MFVTMRIPPPPRSIELKLFKEDQKVFVLFEKKKKLPEMKQTILMIGTQKQVQMPLITGLAQLVDMEQGKPMIGDLDCQNLPTPMN